MSSYRTSSKRPSWGSIIFFMVFFFPVGFYLLFKRNTIPKHLEDRRNYSSYVPSENHAIKNSGIPYDKGDSWGPIIFMLIIFFPIGIAMLIKKVTSEKHLYNQNGKAMIILGSVLIAFGIIYLSLGLSQIGESTFGVFFMMLLICIGGGLILLQQGAKFRRRANKINRYFSIIRNSNDLSFKNIAAVYPTSYTSVCRDIQLMIDSKLLNDAYLDMHNEELIISNKSKRREDKVYDTDLSSTMIKCPDCGAVNKIVKGGHSECEYCGTTLQ